ncbi:unnamed protein product [Allacma fusca]|uniref:Uncharacterized protein n=1 Tax=Allacma fusca TaxID=39272 RepID=A0A8J2J459_9HEXA|nr:unnamed protein product [Allacma fusca]
MILETSSYWGLCKIKIYMLCTEASKLADAAGSFGGELAEMSHKQQSGLENNSNRKVESLANQIASNPLTISASDYFHVNRKLFTAIISTITTYLIILVQNRTLEKNPIKLEMER